MPAAHARFSDAERQTPARVEVRPARERNTSVPRPRPSGAKNVSKDQPAPFRLTLRMTADQRRRLRIVAAQKDQTLQKSASEALDAYLDSLCACAMRDCACLARHENPEAVS